MDRFLTVKIPTPGFPAAFWNPNDLGWGINSELYLYHIDEGSSTSVRAAIGAILRPARAYLIKPAKAAIDFQLETIGQFGTVQATTAANSQNLKPYRLVSACRCRLHHRYAVVAPAGF